MRKPPFRKLSRQIKLHHALFRSKILAQGHFRSRIKMDSEASSSLFIFCLDSSPLRKNWHNTRLRSKSGYFLVFFKSNVFKNVNIQYFATVFKNIFVLVEFLVKVIKRKVKKRIILPTLFKKLAWAVGKKVNIY